MVGGVSRLLALIGLTLSAALYAAPPRRNAELETARVMQRLAAMPAALRVFLQRMPKGGDLHNHLSGAIYAEDLLRWAAADGLCVSTGTIRITPAPCTAPDALPATDLIGDADRYNRTVDGLSTRGFELGQNDPRISGADRFFATFDNFDAAYVGNVGRALAIARDQAAGDHVRYLELQIGSGPLEKTLARDWAAGLDPNDFAGLSDRLAPSIAAAVAAARVELDKVEADADASQKCGTAAAASGCGVRTRYLMAAMRTYAPASVFAELAYGFALARADPRIVGVNLAAPEHHPVATRDYRLHMAMIAFLRRRYPEVPVSLHAGEITLGMVAPRDLRFHIHDAVAVAGARRIGHGVDIVYEEEALPLLRRMARERIAVEINLTSNAVILGVRGKAHPLALYRAAGVPVVLSTDDEGVSRTDMTNEYVRAVIEQGLDYHALKRIARDSLHYAFAPGADLWIGDAGGAVAAPCADGWNRPACIEFSAKNEKAGLERALELEFVDFETKFTPELARSLDRYSTITTR